MRYPINAVGSASLLRTEVKVLLSRRPYPHGWGIVGVISGCRYHKASQIQSYMIDDILKYLTL